MKRAYALALAFALLLVGSPAAAQTFGEISGTVADPSGAVIAGAKVTITNTATNVARTVETNATGSYAVPFLNPGVYNLRAELEGFKTATVTNRIVEVGDVQELNLTLEIGAVTEVVEVQAGAQMLNTSDSSLGTVIDQERIVELPINGRNYLNLVKLSTNVSAEQRMGGQANGRQGGSRANQSISVSGQRNQFNRFTLDGVENTDPNFNTFVIRPSVDALQEFKVQTGVYSAQFGKATSQINVTTKAGGNEFHGAVFEFLRNDKIQARTWNQPGEKDPFRRNQFGFVVTGPIVKNKLFFMANYEGFRERVQGFSQSTVADQAMRNGDFSNTGAVTIFDPDTIRTAADGSLTADAFPNQTIPTARFKQPFVQMLEFLPMPNVAGAAPGIAPVNYTRNSPNPLDWDQFTTRIDFNQNTNSQWFGRYSWNDEFLGDGGGIPIEDRRVETKVDQFMLSNIYTLSPTIVNELRLGANLFDNSALTALNGIRDVSGELGIPGLISPIEAAWGTPRIGMSGSIVRAWGESTGGPFINNNRTYQIVDNMSVIRGSHTIKFGGEVGDVRYNQVGNQFPRGLLQFSSRGTANPNDFENTGDAFASGLLGWMDEATRSLGIANVQFRQKYFHLYAEDTWRINSKLTMNLGVRYEYTPPFQDRYRGIMNFRFECPGVDETGIDEACPVPVQVRPGDGDFHEGLLVHLADNVPTDTGDDALFNHATIKRDTNDWGPRIGFAYQPDQKTTIRTGFGVYYSQDTGNPIFDMGRNFGFRQSARGLETRPTVNLDSPWATAAGGGGAQCSNWDGPCVNGLYSFSNDARRKTPNVMQFLFNIQRQLTDTALVEVGYSGNQGRNLQRMFGYNDPVQRADPTDLSSVDQRRPWGGNIYGRIQTIGGVSSSSYNALALKFRQRNQNGLTYLFGYTWSRAIDYGSAIRNNGGDTLFPASEYNFGLERGLSQFHTGHRVTASILYDLPISFENRVLEAIAGGWQLGSILTFSTGTPLDADNCGDIDSNTLRTRGDANGVSPFVDNPTPQEFFVRDPTDGRGPGWATCNVPVVIDGTEYNELTARLGNINRNALLYPGFANMDFSMTKRFAFTERYGLEFRFESYNFTNHPNWNGPNTGRNSLNYGVITSARSMRTNQFALKFTF